MAKRLYTYDDIMNLPDFIRVELIDGVIHTDDWTDLEVDEEVFQKAEKYIYSVLDHDANYQQLINHIKDNPEYIKQQEAFHKKNLMRKEYYHIFYELPELAPKSFSAYSRMKNAQTKNFLKLKDQAIKHGISIS